jgi:hypothetical protein
MQNLKFQPEKQRENAIKVLAAREYFFSSHYIPYFAIPVNTFIIPFFSVFLHENSRWTCFYRLKREHLFFKFFFKLLKFGEQVIFLQNGQDIQYGRLFTKNLKIFPLNGMCKFLENACS